jgi:hypothetical protein
MNMSDILIAISGLEESFAAFDRVCKQAVEDFNELIKVIPDETGRNNIIDVEARDFPEGLLPSGENGADAA